MVSSLPEINKPRPNKARHSYEVKLAGGAVFYLFSSAHWRYDAAAMLAAGKRASWLGKLPLRKSSTLGADKNLALYGRPRVAHSRGTSSAKLQQHTER